MSILDGVSNTTTFLTPSTMKTISRWVASVVTLMALQACAVIAVADAAVTVVATGVKFTAKAVGAVADAVIPDGDDD